MIFLACFTAAVLSLWDQFKINHSRLLIFITVMDHDTQCDGVTHCCAVNNSFGVKHLGTEEQ